jgi:hypothetical protein
MAKYYTSEATRDTGIFLRIQKNTFRRTADVEKERVKQALVNYEK